MKSYADFRMKHFFLIFLSVGIVLPMSKPVLANDINWRARIAGMSATAKCAIKQRQMTKIDAANWLRAALDKNGLPREALYDRRIKKASEHLSDELVKLNTNCLNGRSIERSLGQLSESFWQKHERILR